MVLSQGDEGADQPIATPPLPAPDPAPQRPLLVPFCFWLHRTADTATERLPPDPAVLRDAIHSHLAERGWPAAEPLRWAITAVDPLQGLRLEGVGVIHALASEGERP